MESRCRRAEMATEGQDIWTLRPANDRDLQEVVRIEQASFGDPWSDGDFRSVMAVRHAIFLVAEDSARKIGGYVITMAVTDESEVLNIAVDPERRGAALGALLLDAALAEAEKRGARSTFLEVRESNEPALRLYRSRGFEEISRRRRYYKSPVEDALVLRRAVH